LRLNLTLSELRKKMGTDGQVAREETVSLEIIMT
jgi:hypothetical protein